MKKKILFQASEEIIAIHCMASLQQAFNILQKKGFRHLPVVDDSEALVGMISDTDLQRAIEIDQPDFGSGRAPHATFPPLATVRDFMSWPVESIDQNASTADAARMMLDKKISSLIVSDGPIAVGIVTTDDMLREVIHLSGPTVASIKDRIKSAFFKVGSYAQALADVGV
ncbi:hypothetical protein BH10BDE1_BH10BDE1_09420 [soil metagenome]